MTQRTNLGDAVVDSLSPFALLLYVRVQVTAAVQAIMDHHNAEVILYWIWCQYHDILTNVRPAVRTYTMFLQLWTVQLALGFSLRVLNRRIDRC